MCVFMCVFFVCQVWVWLCACVCMCLYYVRLCVYLYVLFPFVSFVCGCGCVFVAILHLSHKGKGKGFGLCTRHVNGSTIRIPSLARMSYEAVSNTPTHKYTHTKIHTHTHTHKDTHTETLRSLCINVVGRTDCVFTPETERISLSLSVLFTHSLSLYLSPRLDIKQERCFRNGSFLRFLLKTADDCTLLFTKTVGAAGSCLKLWVEENAHSYITLVYCF